MILLWVTVEVVPASVMWTTRAKYVAPGVSPSIIVMLPQPCSREPPVAPLSEMPKPERADLTRAQAAEVPRYTSYEMKMRLPAEA